MQRRKGQKIVNGVDASAGVIGWQVSLTTVELFVLQRWAKVAAPGCVNAAGKLRQKW